MAASLAFGTRELSGVRENCGNLKFIAFARWYPSGQSRCNKPKGMKLEIESKGISLDKMGDDVKFLAPCLIHNKQLDKQLDKFINLLMSNESAVDEDEIKMYTVKYPDIPTLYIHPFKNNTIEGFPLYFIAQKFKENEEVCIQRMELILKLDSDINAKHRNEPTALHYAVEQGMWQVVQFLIDKGACDVDGGKTKDLIAEVKPELAQTLDIMTPKPQFDSILFEALYDNDEVKLKNLLQNQPSVNIDNGKGKQPSVDIKNGKETLLQLAVSQKRESSVAELITNGVDVNATIPPSKFETMFDSHMTYEPTSRNKKLTLIYDFLKSDNEEFDEPEMPIFYQMSKIKKYKATLAHPLIKLFLIYKCKKVVFVSILHLILYLLFAFSLSVHVYNLIERREDQNEKNGTYFQTKDSSTSIHLNNVNNSTIIIYNNATILDTNSSNSTTVDDDSTHTTTYIVGGIFWVIIFLREIFEFANMPLEYLRNWENALDIALLIFSLLSYIPTRKTLNSCKTKLKFEQKRGHNNIYKLVGECNEKNDNVGNNENNEKKSRILR
ncbi:hypothetical protein B566_EDAN015580, partial [Ephemera danica]